MKRTLTNLIILLIIGITFYQCKTNNPNGIIVRGNVENSNQDYIILSYSPRYRGNPSFDGFTNIGSQIGENGKFKLSSENVTDGAEYNLLFKNSHIKLRLFKGDNITVNFDINKPNESLFVTGRGAGKINILSLEQFKRKFFSDLNYAIPEYKKYSDSIALEQLTILNSIFEKDLKADCFKSAKNQDIIERIINENTLSQKEYDYVSLKIYLRKLSLSAYISYLCEIDKQDSTELDLNNKLFDDFDEQNYKKITNLNDWTFEDALETIITFERLKSIQNSGKIITMKNWNNMLQETGDIKWMTDYISKTFNSDVFDMLFAEQVVFYMSLGMEDYQEYYEFFKDNCTNQKYLDWINNYKSLLANGLNNTVYNLNSEELTLDKIKFDKVIEENKAKPIFFVFWSARYAGGSVIQDLPALKDFMTKYKDKINVVNICLDEAKYKDLWALKIIDNSWKGKHYFMPFENNDSTLNAFTSKDISSLCSGGVTYAIMNSDGDIINNVESPIRLLNGETDNYLEKTVR